MYYEKYETMMQQFDMNLDELIHGLNLLHGAKLPDYELRTALRKVDSKRPKATCKVAKKSLKKCLCNLRISNSSITKVTPAYNLIKPKQETLFLC